MTLSKYIELVLHTNKDVFLKKELQIEKDFNANILLLLCSKNILEERLKVAWEMIISAFVEKFKDAIVGEFFPEEVLNFLIENDIALGGLSHLRLPERYLIKIYEKDNRCWEALKNITTT